MKEAAAALKDWLETNSERADSVYGGHFQDPAKAALYADTMKEITDEMSRHVDAIATEWAENVKKPRLT